MRLNTITIGLFMYLILLPVPADAETALDGPEIIQRVSDLMNQPSVQANIKLTIVTTSGSEREFTYNSYSTDRGEKNAVVYTDPVRVKGQAMLLLNNADDIWVYYPRTDRVRKMATHAKKQKMQGSDFTYEDMGSGDSWLTDFTATRLEDEHFEDEDCYRVMLSKNAESNSAYAKIIMWVLKDNFVPVVVDYYDEDEPEVRQKRLTQSDIEIIQEIPTPTSAVMHNYLDESDTRMKITECKYNVEIDQSRFTQRGFHR